MTKKRRSFITILLQWSDTFEIKRPCLRCPCGEGAMLRYIKCNEEKTDGLRLHYEKCNICGFEFYAHNENNVKGINNLYNKFISSLKNK